jgi:hypothetical protein
MTRIRFQEFAIEASVVAFSGTFLLWYIVAKISVWPWGAFSY